VVRPGRKTFRHAQQAKSLFKVVQAAIQDFVPPAKAKSH
jgi:hypothetical protein